MSKAVVEISLEERAEILEKMVKEVVRKEGLRFDSSKRRFGNISKATGVDRAKVGAILKPICQELFDEAFS